jgi:hypothetical protein
LSSSPGDLLGVIYALSFAPTSVTPSSPLEAELR